MNVTVAVSFGVAHSSWSFVDFCFWHFMCIFQAHMQLTLGLAWFSPSVPPTPHNTRDLHLKLYTRLAVKCEWRNCRLQMKEREREITYVDVKWTYAKWIHKMGLRETEDDVSCAYAAGCNPQTIHTYMHSTSKPLSRPTHTHTRTYAHWNSYI